MNVTKQLPTDSINASQQQGMQEYDTAAKLPKGQHDLGQEILQHMVPTVMLTPQHATVAAHNTHSLRRQQLSQAAVETIAHVHCK